MSAQIFAITNQKGGVGKTTTAVNLTASLAATKHRVLLIDLDPQGNATTGCGVDKHTLSLTINDLLLSSATFKEVKLARPLGFDLIGANSHLTVAEVRLLSDKVGEQKLKLCLEDYIENYDFILIDCPPSLNLLTINALRVSQGVIVPVQCEYYALEGLAALMNTIEQVQKRLNPQLSIHGLLRTMYDGRTRLSVEISDQLKTHFGNLVYQTIIPRNVRLAEAPSHGLPIFHYDKRSQGAAAYLAFAAEIQRKQMSFLTQEERCH